MRIAIIGGGLAGLCAAHGLLEARAGEITVFERSTGVGLETSFANGALLHPSAVDPWNTPGIAGFLLKNFGNPHATVMVRASALPSLVGWGLRFLRESSADRHRAHTLANVTLALHSLRLMQGLRDAGIDYGHERRGSLMTHRDAAAFAQAQAWSRMLQDHGVPSRVLSRDELVAAEPALVPVAQQLVGAIHNLADESGDAYRFCVSLAASLSERGVVLRLGTEVAALQGDRRKVSGLSLADGSSERFDVIVLAAAVWSRQLLRPLGLDLPVRPAKGYSVTLPQTGAEPRPRTPVVDNGLHIAVVPVVGGRLRVAGTAELCGFDRRVDPIRVDNLMRQLREVYPAIADATPPSARQVWTGLRPLCADGKPLIGATRIKGLFLSTGHGQLGWTTGVGSGQLLASLVAGQAPAIDASPFAPSRFDL